MITKNTLTLLFVRAELKSRRLGILLHQLGVEEQCPWLPSFNDIIAECLDIKTDEEFLKYDKMMEVHASHIARVEDILATATLILEHAGVQTKE